MHKRFLKKPWFLAGALALAFAVLAMGGIALSSSAYAASLSTQSKNPSAANTSAQTKTPPPNGLVSPGKTKTPPPSFDGVIAQIDGSTITLQSKNLTQTVHLTAQTTYVKVGIAQKTKGPASRGDLKVGETIEATGALNGSSLTAEFVVIFV
ncbi:MAG TPA: DUF5666 domain-containing protein [Ktedonobacteraceae bacterium]